jgi:hypothetical protein
MQMEVKTLDEKLCDILSDKSKGKYQVIFLNNDNIDWKNYDIANYTIGIARQSNSQIGQSLGSILERREYNISFALVSEYALRKCTKDDIEHSLSLLNGMQFKVDDRIVICNYNGCMTSNRTLVNGIDYEVIDFNFSFTLTDNLSSANNTIITIDDS